MVYYEDFEYDKVSKTRKKWFENFFLYIVEKKLDENQFSANDSNIMSQNWFGLVLLLVGFKDQVMGNGMEIEFLLTVRTPD